MIDADEIKLLQGAIVGIITGLFSAGTIYGVFKTHLFFIRRDLDEVRHFIWPERHRNANARAGRDASDN